MERCSARSGSITACRKHSGLTGPQTASAASLLASPLNSGVELAPDPATNASDMWKPYLQLIEQHCTRALNILDRFHVVAKMNLALDPLT